MLARGSEPAFVPLHDVAYFMYSSTCGSHIGWCGTHSPDRDRVLDPDLHTDHRSRGVAYINPLAIASIYLSLSRSRCHGVVYAHMAAIESLIAVFIHIKTSIQVAVA